MMQDWNPLLFLAVNFGLFWPLALAALFRALVERAPERLTLVPGLAAFASLFFLMLAPWEWDNTKVMQWCYLLVLPAIDRLVLGRVKGPLRAVALGGLFFSGAVAVAAASRDHGRFEIFDTAELEAVCRGLEGVALSDRVATLATFNHPVSLCGHPIVAGYFAHLWSHGSHSGTVPADLDAVSSGQADWRELARRVRAKLLFWGWRETMQYPSSTRPWEGHAPVVATGPWGRLYRLED